MPTVRDHASTILGEFEQAQTELVGKAVILTDGKAGTVESVWLDEMHGLAISIRRHNGEWSVCLLSSNLPANAPQHRPQSRAPASAFDHLNRRACIGLQTSCLLAD